MSLRKKAGFLLFIFAFVFLYLGVNINLTGNVVRDYFNQNFLMIHFIGLIFLAVSIFLLSFEKKETLDYLLVPTGWKKQRKLRTLEELGERDVKNILILNGRDSEEDILYLGKKLKGNERIGIVTFPLHYHEYRIIIKKAEKKGKFPKRVKIENIRTKETPKQFIYGILGLLEEKLKGKEIDYKKNRPDNYLVSKVRKFAHRVLKEK